jgi:hypothetical protein
MPDDNERKSPEELYTEARVLHKSLKEMLQTLQEKPYLTPDEELEVKLLKKLKLFYKDRMEMLKTKMAAPPRE